MILRKRFNGFTYSLLSDENKLKWLVEPDTPEITPKLLCKFFSLNRHNVDLLRNQSFYVSNPSQFNDIFDCSTYMWDLDDLSVKEITHYFGEVFQADNTGYDEESIRVRFEENKLELLEDLRINLFRKLRLKTGLLCLSPNKTDELMWAYYGGNMGFLVEYDHSQFAGNFHGPFKVNYVETLPKLKLTKSFALDFLIQSTIKKSKWSHESEYRYIVDCKDGFYDGDYRPTALTNRRIEAYLHSSVKGIYIGFNMFLYEELDRTRGQIILVSDLGKSLIKEFLEIITVKKYPIYLMYQDKREFVLKPLPINFERLDEFAFTIKYL